MAKILFLDIDGTLVGYSKALPALATEAVRSARRAGHRVYFCTGRSRADIPQELWDIGVDGMIGGNGSYVEHRGRVVEHQSLTSDETREVVDWLKSRGNEFFLECNAGLFGSENFSVAAVPVYRRYIAGTGRPVPDDLRVDQILNGYVEGGELYRDDVNKISFILNDYQDFLDAVEAFPDLKAGVWGGRDEEPLFGDLGVPHIDKASGIQTLLSYLDVSREDTIGFGDAAPDLPMLEYCGAAVAMGNASEEVKAIADHVTTDVDEGGLYAAFENLGLLER